MKTETHVCLARDTSRLNDLSVRCPPGVTLVSEISVSISQTTAESDEKSDDDECDGDPVCVHIGMFTRL